MLKIVILIILFILWFVLFGKVRIWIEGRNIPDIVKMFWTAIFIGGLLGLISLLIY